MFFYTENHWKSYIVTYYNFLHLGRFFLLLMIIPNLRKSVKNLNTFFIDI